MKIWPWFFLATFILGGAFFFVSSESLVTSRGSDHHSQAKLNHTEPAKTQDKQDLEKPKTLDTPILTMATRTADVTKVDANDRITARPVSIDDQISQSFRRNQKAFVENMETLLAAQQADDLWSESAESEIQNTVADDNVLPNDISISRIECKRTLCIVETPSVRQPQHLHELARRLHQGDFLITAPWVRYHDEGVDKMVLFRKDFVFE